MSKNDFKHTQGTLCVFIPKMGPKYFTKKVILKD
jgi:hypothetical protein